MNISHFNYGKNCDPKTVKILEIYKNECCTPNTKIIHESSLDFYDNIESLDKFSPQYGLYILAKNPKRSLKKLMALPNIDDEHIITVVGESQILYSSKFSMMISQFLHREAYLSKRQSQAYFTVLQEGLLNAIEHGNLDLSHKKKETIQQEHWFDTYHGLSKDILKNTELGEKLVVIQCFLKNGSIVTRVIDEGKGFKNISKKSEPNTDVLPHGRGIDLIKGIADELHFKQNGRCLEFYFNAHFLNNSSSNEALNLEAMRGHTNILIVDDQASNLKIAELYLKTVGYKNIFLATSGKEAIEMADKIVPDVIILDVIMPEMDGFTTCRKIKQLKHCVNIPILFFTGLDDSKSRVKGYRLGAVDYVTKPIQRNELTARTDVHVQHSMMLKTLNKTLSRIKEDLGRARASQLDLLPSKGDIEMIEYKYELSIDFCFNTCDELAGDYWNIIEISDDKLAIIMADFTGHGVTASLNTVRLHSLIQGLIKSYHDPERMILEINAKLKKLIPLEDFATFIYIIFNTKTGKLTYIGCGTPPIAIIPNDAHKKCSFLSCSGVPLGLIDNKDMLLEVKTKYLREGESLFLFSDALIETTHSKDNKMWGEKKLLQSLDNINKKYKTPTMRHILKIFNKTAQMPLKDDLTMLYIHYKVKNINREFPQSYKHPDALLKELLG